MQALKNGRQEYPSMMRSDHYDDQGVGTTGRTMSRTRTGRYDKGRGRENGKVKDSVLLQRQGFRNAKK